MKKIFKNSKRITKIISVLTSAAVMGTMTTGSLAAYGSEESCPVGLELVSDKTNFTLDEVRSRNAETVVYVDSLNAFSEDELISSVQFELQPEVWKTVDPLNLELCSSNVFSVDKGNKIRYFNTIVTSTGSIWDEEIPSVRYSINNYAEIISEYSEGSNPSVVIMSDSSTGKIKALEEDDDCYAAQFDVKLPADLEAGEYTINIVNAFVTIGDVSETDTDMETVEITELAGITITVEDEAEETTSAEVTDITEETTSAEVTDITEETTSAEVTDITEETTSAEVTDITEETISAEVTDITEETTSAEVTVITEETTVTEATTVSQKGNYIGSCDLWVESGVNAAVGDTVQVPVYIDTFGYDVQAIGARVVYDTTALKLTAMYDPFDLGYEASGLEVPGFTMNKSTGIFIIMTLNYNKLMVNDPSLPIIVLEFTVLDGASGEYEISLENNLTSDKEIEVIHNTYADGIPNDYFSVNNTSGSVIVGDIHATTMSKTTTTTTTKVTTVTTTTSAVTTTTTTTEVTTTTSVTTTVITQYQAQKGDLNSDTVINVSDVVIAQKFLLKIRVRAHINLMDMNNDGRYNIFDLMILKRVVLYE